MTSMSIDPLKDFDQVKKMLELQVIYAGFYKITFFLHFKRTWEAQILS